MALTNRQLLVLDFIKRFIAENGYSPTVREIARGLSLKSPSTVQDHLKKLVINGIITINPNKSRTIELLVQNEYLNQDEKIVSIPLLENSIKSINKEFIDVPSFMIGDYDSRNIYAFKYNNSIYIVNTGLALYNRLSLTIKDGTFMLEDIPQNDIFGNVISEFKQY